MAGSEGSRETPLRTRRWLIALLLPILVFVFSQLEFVQNAEGHLIEGLFWDIGKWDIIADIVAPLWVASIVILGALNRRLLLRLDGPREWTPKTRFGRRFATDAWVRRSTWIATSGAVLILILSWTREWARFGEQPEAFWYVLVIAATLVVSAIPIWWLRHDLHDRVQQGAEASPLMGHLDAYLFDATKAPARWPQVVVLAGLTLLAALVVLGQLNALLQGMHPAGAPAADLGALPGLFDLDLSQKRAFVAERVEAWAVYSGLVGSAFATAYGVAVLSIFIDSLVVVPAYTVLIAILLLRARRSSTESIQGTRRRTYDMLISAALVVLAVTAIVDLMENAVTWRAIWWAWNDIARLDDWHVRVMWFTGAAKTIGFGILLASGILLLALREQHVRGLGQSMIAVRGELLVLAFLAIAVLMLPQVADVIRRWDVAVTLITAVFAVALAMLLQYTSSRTMRGLRRDARRVEAGEELTPAVVHWPWSTEPVGLRRSVVAAIFLIAGLQVVLVGAFDLPVGLGFVIPVALITIVWLFGIPLPDSPYERGDRRITDGARRLIPRFLGSAVFVVLGVAVIEAAVPELIYARHADWWLFFAILPPAVGLYRVHSRTAHTMGRLELLILAGIGIVGGWLIIVEDNPELSAVALAFTGLMLLFGSIPFFYSYDPDSGPSHFAATRLQWLGVQPLVAGAVLVAFVAAIATVASPLTAGTGLGTTAVMLLGSMLFAAIAAALVAFAERTRPPKFLASFRVKRTPVFVFLGAWLVLAGMASTGPSNDVAVVVDTDPGRSSSGVTIDDVWDRWLERNETPPVDAEAGERPAIPLVFIASSGGGVRAAVWTSYVLDCLFAGDVAGMNGCPGAEHEADTDPVILMSGVSGGSLGLASFSAQLVSDRASPSDDWVKERLDDDYLAASMAWLLLVDTPRSFIGFGPRIRDRAELMELAWEQSWAEGSDAGFLSRGIFDVWHTEPEVPLLVFNGTTVGDPCRFNASVLDANAHDPADTCTSLEVFENSSRSVSDHATLAATQDLSDFLCPGQDIRVSTAALMTARFPVVSPSGRIGGHLSACGLAPRVAHVVDGGYLEASAAGTVMELWDKLESRVETINADETSPMCVVPFLIQIDNGYENPGAAGSTASPRETLVPLNALLGSQFGRMANAREQAAIEFDEPLVSGGDPLVVVHKESREQIDSRYARVVTRAHPGIQAPLGWTLSNASMDDLKSQLLLEENQTELEEIQRWLDRDLVCVTP